MKLEQSLAHL